jgi:serine/threonine-protein kinase
MNDGARVRPIGERGAEWIGKIVDDKYKVLRFVDSGGTAEVYEAERTTTGKRVALKLLHAALATKPELMESFLQEAQLVSLIAHPNIVAIQDFGTLAGASGPLHYMVMELLDGSTLATEIARDRMSPLLSLQYAMQACEGLAAAHTRDVVHCDIKPANIFLQRVPGSNERVVKILDLGLGRLFARSAAVGLEETGVVAGTPEYMSPEQAMGRPVGPASDIYAMGITLYELLLGEVPFTDPSHMRILKMHVSTPPPWPEERAEARGLPPGTRDVIWRALSKEPDRRQGSMLELQSDLAALARHEKGRASNLTAAVTATLPPPPTARQRPAPASTQPREARRSRTGVSREDVFDAREGDSSGRWSMPPALRSSDAHLAKMVPLARATGADDEVVELAPDVYWVGRRHGGQLECNAFLRVFKRGGTEVSLLIDPGPPTDLSVVTQKTSAVLGSLRRLDFVFLSHPDPDVGAGAAPIQQRAPRARVVCSEDTFRLAQFYGLDPARFLAVESFEGGRCKLATGHELVFVPTPFCHFQGAVMVYDPESRVLFSGDLFGGARSKELGWSDKSWAGVEIFHQLTMPSRRALELAVERVRRLDPPPTLIAPQHGALVTGDDVPRMLEQVSRMSVGLDLMEPSPLDERFLSAANDLVRELAELAGKERAGVILESSPSDTSLSRVVLFDADQKVRGFRVSPRLALDTLAADALAALPAEQRGDLQRSIREIWKQHEIEGGPRSTLTRAGSADG